MLVRWCDWLTANGYFRTSIQSNYGVGHYLTKACAAVVLAGTPDGDRLKAEVLAYRTATTLPQLAQLAGGFWPEGWNYGALAGDGLLIAAEVKKQAGWIDGLAEKAWIGDVCEHLRVASSAPGIVISAGDYYATPAPMPGGEYLYLYAALADPVKGGKLASQGVLPAGWKALSYPPLPSVQPAPGTSRFAAATGLTLARSGYTPSDSWGYFLAGNLLSCDHQQGAPGHFELWRGPDPLIPNCISYSKLQTPSQKTTQSNTLVADANGNTTYQVYRFNQAFWYGTPGVVTLAQTDDGDIVHTATDCKASYSTNLAWGGGGPLSKWVRHFVLVRSLAAVLVVDFLTVKDQTFYKEFRLHVSPGPLTVTGTSFTIDRGASRLSGVVLSGQPLTVTQAQVAADPGPATVPQLRFIGPAVATMAFVGVFQAGPTGATFPVPAYWTDGVAEGCLLAGRRFSFDGLGGFIVA
jgi:hypothetical protein